MVRTSSARRRRVLVGGYCFDRCSRKNFNAINPSACGMHVYSDLTSIVNRNRFGPLNLNSLNKSRA